MTAVIHINDNNLLIQKLGQSGYAARSQGYAWLKQGDVYFDQQQSYNAAANCRLVPQQINSRYWQQCDQTSIPGNKAGMRHAADLVWRHLSELTEKQGLTEVVLVVPSHYQKSNLQLLLGIAKTCELNVLAVINKSVLALQDRVSQAGQYLHVDIQLHQTVCTTVQLENGLLSLGNVEVLHDVGVQSMQDSLLKSLQASFIQNNRFDPLHYAETEQQLFDQLPKLATTLAKESKARPAVEYQKQLHNITIDQKQWNDVLLADLKRLLAVSTQSNANEAYFSFNGFPALQLTDSGNSVIDDEFAAPLELIMSAPSPSESGLLYLTDLPANAQRNAADSGLSAAAVTSDKISDRGQITGKVTHLLQAGVAVPVNVAEVSLADNQLTLRQGITNVHQLLSDKKIFVMNDADRSALKPNDRLGSNLADGVISAIEVVQ